MQCWSSYILIGAVDVVVYSYVTTLTSKSQSSPTCHLGTLQTSLQGEALEAPTFCHFLVLCTFNHGAMYMFIYNEFTTILKSTLQSWVKSKCIPLQPHFSFSLNYVFFNQSLIVTNSNYQYSVYTGEIWVSPFRL